MSSPARRSSTVWFVGIATAFSLLGDQTLYSTLPIFFEELGLRPYEVGIILSANRWIRLGTNELAHRLTDVVDQRLMFAAALTLGAITTAIYATTPGFAVFVAARLAWGLCWSFIRHLGVLSVMAASDDGQTGRSAGRLGGISRVGSIGGLLGGAVLVDWLGFGLALLILAGLSVLALPFAMIGFAPVAASASTGARAGRGNLVSSGLGFAHGMVGSGLVLSTLGAVLDERTTSGRWLSATTLTGGVLAVRFVLEGGAAARLGAISDTYGVRVSSVGSFAVGSVALFVASLAPTVPVLIASVVTFFVCGTALGAGLLGFAGSQGSGVLARYVTAADLGAAAGPLVGWIALDLFDQRTLGLAIGAAIYGAAAVAAWTLMGDRPSSVTFSAGRSV
ncbi:MAG: MFS transporter [Acidimicrobiales bacterium]